MKDLMKRLLCIFALYAVMAGVFSAIFLHIGRSANDQRTIAVNRINAEIESADTPADEFISAHSAEWKREYGRNMPEEIRFFPIGTSFRMTSDSSNIVYGIVGEDGAQTGFVQYSFGTKQLGKRYFTLILLALLTAYVLCTVLYIYVYYSFLMPFRKLSQYPERLARLHTKEKLPETKNRNFGKYVWGMNMLCDMLESDRKRISRLEADRQTLLASLAHSVKTPVANIRLYSQGMKMGLYKDKDAILDTADKIESNAMKLEKVTVEMIETASTSVSGFDPEIEQFYLKELAEMIETEFADRLNIKRIPYTIDIQLNPILTTDKWALFRVVAQIIENAMKYGDGGGIAITLFKEDDDVCISVKNRGKLLPESELPYVFKSYWRGSNASDIEGSGIGLFTAREVLKVLGGSIAARRLEDTSEMEFVICLGQCE